ncbi:MAG: hypothetical protein BGO29_14965 [Bacteroidales bacterium 36-12]|nr:MAG: hypothetical protein BGO29_14965 [Bacteroidales bacterium 36-12]
MSTEKTIEKIIETNKQGADVKILVNEALKLLYAESMTRKEIEENVYNNFRTQMSRIKDRIGFNVVYTYRGKILTVTRLEDEEIR